MSEMENRGQAPGADPSWERKLLERLAFEQLREQRRARRWGVFFRILLFTYLLAILALYWPDTLELPGRSRDHTALVDIEGLITEHAPASGRSVIRGLRAAFEAEGVKGVILRVNSPGGSAVQSGYVHDEVKRLREKHPEVPVYAVITDMCASGGYYVAAAADKIYADKASIVGSIGVRMDSFGFVDAIQKLGVERRLLTAGEHKGLLDPFLPVKAEEVAHLEGLLEEIHGQFIERVRQGRGDRLGSDPRIFSGLIWTGSQGKELGLVDDLASSDYVAREIIGAERIVNYTRKPDYLERLTERFGLAVGRALANWVAAPLGGNPLGIQ